MRALEVKVDDAGGRLDALEAEVTTGEGLAPRKPIRTRLHDLESEHAAANAARAALSAIDARRTSTLAGRLTVVNAGIAIAALLWTVLHG